MKVMIIWPAADYSTKDVAVGLRKGLIAAGCDVVDYPLPARLELAIRALSVDGTGARREPEADQIPLLACEAIVFKAIMHGVDWVIGVHGFAFHPAAIVALRRVGIRAAWWFTEAPYETNDDRELALASHMDIAFVNERSSVADFQRAVESNRPGARAYYLRHAYDPDTHYPRPIDVTTPEERADVLFIGTGFTERQHLFECCDWTGINLVLGGLWRGLYPNYRLFPHLKYPLLHNAEVSRLYAGAKLVVNEHRDGGPTAESANPRVWELAACGVFQISDYRQEIVDVLGDAVPTYAQGVPWQFATLIRQWLKDDAGRARLAALARERVQGETFDKRGREIVAALTDYDSERRGSRRASQLMGVT